MAYRLQVRKDTAEYWEIVNPVLANGEPGFETDTNKLKVGNGSDYWNDLPYISPEVDLSSYATQSYVQSASANVVSYLVDSAPSALNTLNELAAALNDDENFSSTVTSSLSGKQGLITTHFATKTGQQSFNESSPAEISSLSASITFSSSSQKVLINASIPAQSQEAYTIQLRRGSTVLQSIHQTGNNYNLGDTVAFTWIDSPGVGTFYYNFYLSFNYSTVTIPSTLTSAATMAALII